MQVRQLLALVKDEPLVSYKPEAAMIIDLIRDKTKVVLHVSGHTGNSILTYINGLDEALAEHILSFELNDGLDLRAHQRNLQRILEEKNRTAKIVQIFIVLGMCFLLTILTAVYVYAIFNGKTIPGWEVTFILFGGPIAVIWQFQGVFSTENKDFLFAALGRTPPGNMISTIASALRGNTRSSDRGYRSRDDDYPRPPSVAGD